MSAIVLLVLIWLLLPVFGEWFINVTTKPLLRVSEEVYGFWDMVQGKFDLFAPPKPVETMTIQEALDWVDEQTLGGAPPKGNWKDEN